MPATNDALRAEIERYKLAYLAFFLLFCIMCVIYAIQFYNVNPAALCEKWGGVLYADSHCYMVADMGQCLTPEGHIKNGPAMINNITVVVG